jgi:hypothetical protein
MDVLNVAVFENNSKLGKFNVKLLDHLLGHLSLQVKDLAQPDTVHKGSNVFINLSIEEFIESSCSQSVDKVFNFRLLSWHSEGEVEINRNVSIIFGWTVMNLIG